MVKKLLIIVTLGMFGLSLTGAVLAADITGKVTHIKRVGRYITVKSNDGKSVTVRISSSSTELNGVGNRAEIKKGQIIRAIYDENDQRKTATSVIVK